MGLPQKKFREAVFQVLYGVEISGHTRDEVIPVVMEHLSMSKGNAALVAERAFAIMDKVEELDALIAKTSTDYPLEKIGRIEKNILRLALYEVLFAEEVPKEVAIAEALRLTKKFANPESTKYVHALLTNAHP